MEQNNKSISRWMQWYNDGGREKSPCKEKQVQKFY